MVEQVERLRREKLIWKCRRGLLELDLVLERYRGQCMEGMHGEDKELGNLMALLDLPDNDLWDIISGRSDRFEDKFQAIVAQLRAV